MKTFAESLIERLGDKELDSAYDLFNRGNAYVEKGEHDRAIIDYTFAIQLDPGYADAYDARGVAYTEKGSYDRAIAAQTRTGDER